MVLAKYECDASSILYDIQGCTMFSSFQPSDMKTDVSGVLYASVQMYALLFGPKLPQVRLKSCMMHDASAKDFLQIRSQE